MNSCDDQHPETYPDGEPSESESSSYHHYRLLESQLQRLEGRMHKMYKANKHFQKTLQSHLLEEATSRDEISRVVNQLTQKVTELQISNSKTTRSKNEPTKVGEQEAVQSDIQKEVRQQLKQESNRISRIEKQLMEVTNTQNVLRNSVDEQMNSNFAQLKSVSEATHSLESKFTRQIEEALTSIQEIIKDYLNDQANVVLQVRSIENRLQEMTKQGQTRLDRESELIDLTPRERQQERKENSPKKKSKDESRAQSLPQSNSATKYPSTAFSKQKNPQPHHQSIQYLRPPSGKQHRTATLQQEDPNLQSSAEKNIRERSFSSKRITQLQSKLKQFEMINRKYQNGPKSHNFEEADHPERSRATQPATSSQKKDPPLDPKEAIQQLKQFKFLLEHTESDMDISNTFNLNGAGPEPAKNSKYKKIEKLYRDAK